MKIGIIGFNDSGKALCNMIQMGSTLKKIDYLIRDKMVSMSKIQNEAELIFFNEIDERTFKQLPDVPIFLNAHCFPGDCDKLSEQHGRRFYKFNTYFTERWSQECVNVKSIDVGCKIESQAFSRLKKLTSKLLINPMSNREAELIQYYYRLVESKIEQIKGNLLDQCTTHHCNYHTVIKSLQSAYPSSNIFKPNRKLQEAVRELTD